MTPTSQTPRLSQKLYRTLLRIFAFVCIPTAMADPAIHIDSPSVNFGVRKTGEIVSHTFTIENKGDEILRIQGIRASCGCTTPDTRELTVSPGASAPLPVRINLTGRRGQQRQFVTLTTNDPENRKVSLELAGEALAELTIEPRTLRLGQIDPDHPESGVITVTSTTGKPFEITRAEANKDRVEITVSPSDDRTSAEINVLPKIKTGDGRFTDVILLETDHPEARSERVLVMWQVHTGVAVTPSEVKLVKTDRPQLLNRYLMIRGYPGIETPLEVLDVQWPGQDQVEIVTTDTKRFGWRIHLKNFAPVESMNDSEIMVKTNDPGAETIRIPVSVVN